YFIVVSYVHIVKSMFNIYFTLISFRRSLGCALQERRKDITFWEEADVQDREDCGAGAGGLSVRRWHVVCRRCETGSGPWWATPLLRSMGAGGRRCEGGVRACCGAVCGATGVAARPAKQADRKPCRAGVQCFRHLPGRRYRQIG